jgi:hypothetical protein
MKKIAILLILWFLFSCSKNNGWGDAENLFLVPLTYPQEDWSKEDFGTATNEAEKKQLQKFLPRVFIAQNSLFPLDFYEDYLPKTVLKNKKGKVVDRAISREHLKAIERNPNFYLDYQGALEKCQLPACAQDPRTIYGRVFYQTMHAPTKYAQEPPISFMVLKYSLVFAASGLPKKMSWHKNIGLSILGDKENWHELDIHGAIHILVDRQTNKPLILLLAQHNHFRSYVIGKDVMLPADNRLNICVAHRSNEPYPCPSQKTEFRTVGNPSDFDFVLGGSSPLFDGGYDIVESAANSAEQNLTLKFLPHRDPLYTSWISLGDKQKILGIIPSFFRDAPPGINMNTTPKLKKYTSIAKVWYFTEQDPKQRELFSQMGGFYNPNVDPLLEYNGARLWSGIASLKK